MIGIDDVLQRLDEASRELTGRFPKHAAEIALLGIAVRRELGRSSRETASVGDMLASCDLIEYALEQVSEELADPVAEVRAAALHGLVRLLYRRKKLAAGPENADAVNREQRIAFLAVRFIKERGGAVPRVFGPGWLERSCPELATDIQSEIYDLETDSFRWDDFSVMLPPAMRSRFDASRTAVQDPGTISSDEQALDVMRQVLHETGLAFSELSRGYEGMPASALWTQLAQHPVARKVLEYVNRRQPQNPISLPDAQSDAPGQSSPE